MMRTTKSRKTFIGVKSSDYSKDALIEQPDITIPEEAEA
jgi:hypothetical protein